jgi:hypothetical protein
VLRCLALAALLVPTAARADVNRCAHADGQVQYTVTDLPDLQADTGWFPDGYVAQLRIVGQMIGETAVAMGLSPTACWDDSMQITVPGIPQSGWLDSEYGAAVDVYGRIHTSVLGYQIDWEGKIPLPAFLPHDFLLAGQTTFEPTALSGTVTVTSNPTSPVIVVSTDVLSELISLGSISGGLDIAVQGQLGTSYQTTQIAVGGGAFAREGDHVTVARPDHGFGATLDTSLSAKGVVHYDPYVIFSVLFDVRIFGIRVCSFDLASVTLPLPAIDRQITLDGGKVSIPLPHLDRIPTQLGFATGASQPLQLHNSGAAPLEIAITTAPTGITAQPITIAPGADATIAVTAADPTMVTGSLELSTNDPNYPSISVALDAASSGETTTPADPPSEGGGGCNSSGGGASVWLALLALLIPTGASRTRPSRR